MALGDRLRQLRQIQGLTLRDLERQSGISNPYLSQLETGKIDNPGWKVLQKLARGLGMRPAALVAFLEREG